MTPRRLGPPLAVCALLLGGACAHRHPAPRAETVAQEDSREAHQQALEMEEGMRHNLAGIDDADVDALNAVLEMQTNGIAGRGIAPDVAAEETTEEGLAIVTTSPEVPLAVGTPEPARRVPTEIETIDHHEKTITFRVRSDAGEIEPVSGRELKVEFAELPSLTGMTADDAIAKMHEGQDVDVMVVGSGPAPRVTTIELPTR